METNSGCPAFSQAQRDYYLARRAKIIDILGDYAYCQDASMLPIPILNLSFTEWRKQDIKVPKVNPVHLALMCGRSSKREEDENFQELEDARQCGAIDEETYNTLHAEVMTRKNNRIRALRGMVRE